MAKPVKITDLTKLEGDPDPGRADIPDARMYLELHAHAPWQAGVVRFVARCSERAPVARALVVAILLVMGIAVAVTAHDMLAGITPGWATATVSLLALFIPSPSTGP